MQLAVSPPAVIENQTPLSDLVNSGKAIQTPDQAFALLKNAQDFADGPVGFAGQTPHEHYALAFLVNHPSGKGLFIKLLDVGSIQTKLYAICGLYFLDELIFDEQVKKYAHDNTKVPVQQGCIGTFSTVSKIILSNTPGLPRVVLRHPREPLSVAQARVLKGHGSFQWDISGGGLPAHIYQLGNR